MRTGNVKQPIYVHEFKVRVLLVYFTHFYAFTWLNFFGGEGGGKKLDQGS